MQFSYLSYKQKTLLLAANEGHAPGSPHLAPPLILLNSIYVYIILSFELENAFDVTVNVALHRPAAQSSTYMTYVASLAVDGDWTTSSSTLQSTTEPWLSVDLGTPMDIDRVYVTNHDHPTYG